MVKKETTPQKNKLIADTFNSYFFYTVKYLSIPMGLSTVEQTSNSYIDRVKASIKNYKDHLSAICIKKKILDMNNPVFSFTVVSLE